MLRALLLAACIMLPAPARAEVLGCAQAAALAEASEGIPAGMLLAIGQVESGRATLGGGRAPWPWTIQANGSGRYLASADEAVAAVQQLRAVGIQSVDIGCFQVNLMHHPDAFTDLASGFDPVVNAMAAARFLSALHAELGNWEEAVAAYHSRTPGLGGPYRDMVYAAWHGTPLLALAAPQAVSLAGWVHIGPGRPMLASAVMGVQVWGPSGAIGAAPAAPRAGLPRVITPMVHP